MKIHAQNVSHEAMQKWLNSDDVVLSGSRNVPLRGDILDLDLEVVVKAHYMGVGQEIIRVNDNPDLIGKKRNKFCWANISILSAKIGDKDVTEAQMKVLQKCVAEQNKRAKENVAGVMCNSTTTMCTRKEGFTIGEAHRLSYRVLEGRNGQLVPYAVFNDFGGGETTNSGVIPESQTAATGADFLT